MRETQCPFVNFRVVTDQACTSMYIVQLYIVQLYIVQMQCKIFLLPISCFVFSYILVLLEAVTCWLLAVRVVGCWLLLSGVVPADGS
jgi:hypothetical protein